MIVYARVVSTVLYGERAGVARITLHRPERLNAMTDEMAAELLDALRRAAGADIRAVLLTGAGRGFCAGSDLRANFADGVPATSDDTLRRTRNPVLLAMRDLPRPIVCAVRGPAAGIGLGLALAADLVVAGESASFDLAFARIGLVPDGGVSWMLQQTIGRARALRLALLGEAVDGATAEAWGLVARCVPDDELDSVATELAERLARGPTQAFALIKRQFDEAPGAAYAAQLELEATLQGIACRTADFAEGRNAFLERRQPDFRGM